MRRSLRSEPIAEEILRSDPEIVKRPGPPGRGAPALPLGGGACHNPATRVVARSKEGGPMPNITIQWYAGRTQQQKREIVAAITDAMVTIGKTTPDQVHIVFQDVERSNWGINGRLAGDPS